MAKEETNSGQETETTAPPAIGQEVVDVQSLPLKEEVLNVKRVTKVVKGGRRFSFNALVVVGDENGHVGIGFGKANEVPDAINKAVQNGKKNIIRVPLLGRTIAYSVIGRAGASKVLLKPAAEGTGIIAGPGVRAVVELAGIKDILTKSLGSDTILNAVKATVNGLKSLQLPERIAAMRGKTLEEIWGKKKAGQYQEFIQSLGKKTAAPEIKEKPKREPKPGEQEIEAEYKEVAAEGEKTEYEDTSGKQEVPKGEEPDDKSSQ